MLIRDWDRVAGGRGGGGGGGESVKARPRSPTRKTEEAVDRRRNNRSVKAVSPRHCAATTECTTELLFQLLCWAESHGQCPLHRC